jgi:membrane protein
MVTLKTKVQDFFEKWIWSVDISSLSSFRAFILKFLRLLYVAVREFTEGHLTLRAMGLVYTTLLSLVPLLAVSFSVLKGFGVHNQIEPILSNFLAPLGAKGVEITDKVIGFVENIKVGVLGTIGISMLIYTVISLIQKIESAFNSVWKIKRSRSFARRFSDYMSVILIGPVLIFSAMGLTATVKSTTIIQSLLSIEPFGTVIYLVSKIIPYFFVCAAFTFIYAFIPNIKVKFRSALMGGVIAGVLWEATGWAFASFVVSSTKYAAIYSGFAILIMFMIWLYISWLILLVGAEVSFYHQYPQFLSVKKETLLLSNRLKERLAILIMVLIGDNYYHNKPAWTFNSLVSRLGLPIESVQDVLETLEKNGFIIETGDEPPSFLPAKDIETIVLRDLLNSVRVAEENSYAVEDKFLSQSEVDKIMEKVDSAVGQALGGETIKAVVLKGTDSK